MFYFDSTYLLVLLGLVIGLIAQGAVKSTYQRYAKVHTQRGTPAHTVVSEMLRQMGNHNVGIQQIAGELTDNYNPTNEILSLSQNVYDSDSIAALGVAAHEAGHAMQKFTAYKLLSLRSAAVPVVNIGSQAAMPIFVIGMIASMRPLMYLGIACFGLAVLFSIITLPVEIDASRRGLQMLRESGFMNEEELGGARKVLFAAAMTYVASALASILNLVRLLLIAGGSNNRRRR